MDYFNWNFLLAFAYITVVIVIGTVRKLADAGLTSLPLSLLMLHVCIQLQLATTVLVPLRARYPFRFSSMARGEPVRPVLYTIIEDVTAVGGARERRSGKCVKSEVFGQQAGEEVVEENRSTLGAFWVWYCGWCGGCYF
jgi:hypothetical protein